MGVVLLMELEFEGEDFLAEGVVLLFEGLWCSVLLGLGF